MSTVSGVNTTDLATSILNKYDSDKNGALSTKEFASFLTSLMGSLGETSSSTSTSSSQATATSLPAWYTTESASTSEESRSKVGDMLGFSSEKLADTTHTSFKYQIGRILQYYPSTPAGLKDALAEIQQLVPEAQITGTNGDKIDFGSYNDSASGKIGVVDVLVGAAQGGKGWAWQPVEE
jgi:hypothetical protein